MGFLPSVRKPLYSMDERIFSPEPMGLGDGFEKPLRNAVPPALGSKDDPKAPQ